MTAIKDTTTGFGTISYNGITFGPLRKSRIVGVPQYDDADRAVKFIRYVLTVHTFVCRQSVAAEETAMDDLQDRLLESGRQLVIEDVGFDLGINTEGSTPDVCWGAKPRLLHFVTMGHVAAEVIWEVEFCINRCASAGQVHGSPFLSFNYDASYSVQDGLTTRTITGSAEVPAIRGVSGNKSVLFNVDAKWDRIVVRVPTNFKRTGNTHRVNEAKNRIDFSFTDTQLPGEAYPPGIIDADLTYSFSNTIQHSFVQWIGTLSGSLTVAPDKPNSLAGVAYFTILADKIAKVRSGATAAVLPLHLNASHRLFTRTSQFSCSFMVPTCLNEILSASGLWSPIAGSNYQQWALSMANVWRNRGDANLRFNSNEDRLVDACVAFSQAMIGSEPSQGSLVRGDFAKPLLCDVTEANSWLSFANSVQGIAHHNSVLHRFAQAFQLVKGGSLSHGGDSYTPHVHQIQGAPDLMVMMTGHALRIKYKFEPPDLISVGGVPAELLAENSPIPDVPKTRVFDCPVYGGQWSRLYRLASTPGSTSLTFKSPRPSSCATS